MLKLHNLTRVYQTEDVETSALNNVNIEISQGEFVAIMGPSGCGKSTLLNTIGMLDSPSSGDYIFNGENVAGYSEKQLSVIRKQSIGFIFQNFNLIDELTVAVVRGDIGQKLLNIQNSPAKQVETTSAISMLEMLLRKRVDAIAYSEDVTYYQLQKLGVEKNTVSALYLLKDDSNVNFVFHKDASSCAIDLFTKKLVILNESGKLLPVWKKYIQD